MIVVRCFYGFCLDCWGASLDWLVACRAPEECGDEIMWMMLFLNA
jgi:hypothetical protein